LSLKLNKKKCKLVVEPKSKSTLIKPTDVKVYVPHFKRNRNEEKAYFSRKDKGKELLKNLMLKNQCLDLVLSIKENLNIFLLVTIMVWLVTLDPIVCS